LRQQAKQLFQLLQKNYRAHANSANHTTLYLIRKTCKDKKVEAQKIERFVEALVDNESTFPFLELFMKAYYQPILSKFLPGIIHIEWGQSILGKILSCIKTKEQAVAYIQLCQTSSIQTEISTIYLRAFAHGIRYDITPFQEKEQVFNELGLSIHDYPQLARKSCNFTESIQDCLNKENALKQENKA
jgi:hypothetical protein